jgi:hypothetical protein
MSVYHVIVESAGQRFEGVVEADDGQHAARWFAQLVEPDIDNPNGGRTDDTVVHVKQMPDMFADIATRAGDPA